VKEGGGETAKLLDVGKIIKECQIKEERERRILFRQLKERRKSGEKFISKRKENQKHGQKSVQDQHEKACHP